MKSFLLSFHVLGLAFLTLPAHALSIVAAENFYGGVAQQIAGEGVTVTSILSNPNQDPHEFTTNAATAKSVADADIVIYSGIGYDSWMTGLLGSAGKPGRVVIAVADLIGAKDGDNPHIWYDPRTMPALAEKLAAILSSVDSSRADVYQKRALEFKSSMEPELEKIATIKATSAGLTVTATEPVFGYMANALGFKMINGDFQVKIMNDAEPTAEETATFEKSLTTHTAKILFYNSQVTDPTTDRIQKIARESGVPTIGVTETQPLEETSYVGWMMHELTNIQGALGAKSP